MSFNSKSGSYAAVGLPDVFIAFLYGGGIG